LAIDHYLIRRRAYPDNEGNLRLKRLLTEESENLEEISRSNLLFVFFRLFGI
jgi:hypothetical protein